MRFIASKLYPFTLLRFCTKMEVKHPFCAFTLIFLVANTEPKIDIFVHSHCSGFVKLIVGYYSVFKKTTVFVTDLKKKTGSSFLCLKSEANANSAAAILLGPLWRPQHIVYKGKTALQSRSDHRFSHWKSNKVG